MTTPIQSLLALTLGVSIGLLGLGLWAFEASIFASGVALFGFSFMGIVILDEKRNN